MKRIIALLLTLLMIVGLFAGCKKDTPAPNVPGAEEPAPVESAVDQNLDKALDYLKAFYQGQPEKTPMDYERIGTIRIADSTYDVVWSVEIPDNLITVVVNADGTVTIDIDEAKVYDMTTETPYVLTATITGTDGRVVSHSWELILPPGIDQEAIEIVKAAYALAEGESLPDTVTLTGTIVSINTPYSSEYGNITVTIAVRGAEDMPITCYRLKGLGVDSLFVDDIITVTGKIKNYKGTIEFDSGCILEAVSPGPRIPVTVPTDPKQIVEDAKNLGYNDSLYQGADVTLTGKVTEINYSYKSGSDNMSVTMKVEGTSIYCYYLTGSGSLLSRVTENDIITVTGPIKTYNGTIEFDHAHLDSVTDKAPPTGVTDLEKILASCEKLSNGKYLSYRSSMTGIITQVTESYTTEYNSISFTMLVDGTDDLYVKAYRVRPFQGTSGFSLGKGDRVRVTGAIKMWYNEIEYVGTYDNGANPYPAFVRLLENNVGIPGTDDSMVAVPGDYVKSEAELDTNTAYKLGLYSTDKGAAYYFTGSMNGYYGATDSDATAGKDMMVEKAEGGWHLYFTKSGVKQYIVMEISGTHKNFTFSSTKTPSLFIFDDANDTFYTVVDGTKIYMGTYGSYTTFGGITGTSDYLGRLYPYTLVDKEEVDNTIIIPQGYFAIYNAEAGIVMTSESKPYNGKDQLVGASATLANGKVTTAAENVVLFEDVQNADGTVSFKTEDGKFLYADGTHVRLVDTEGDNTKFLFEGAYIKCANAQFSGKAQYLEVFSGVFTVYGLNESKAGAYTFGLYNVNKSAASSDIVIPEGQFAIYTEQGGGRVMTTEVSVYNTKDQLASAAATLANGKLTTSAENVAIFTAIKSGDEITFQTADGKYLYADGTHVRLVDSQSDNTKFVIEGNFIRCASAQFGGKAQYLEFYSNVFTVFGMNDSKADIYRFGLYPVTVGEGGGEGGGTETPEGAYTVNFGDLDKTVQYAETNVDLGNGYSLYMNHCQIDGSLKIYNSVNPQYDLHDGVVIFTCPEVIETVQITSGNKSGTLLVYGSTDGTNWTLVDTLAMTTDSKHDITMAEGTAYKYLKLDSDDYQVRVTSITFNGTVSGGEETPDPETPSTGNYVTDASQLSTTATYKLGLFSTAKNATYYFTGAMSGYYGATETDWATAIDVQLEAANGGYYLTFTKDSKQYVNIVASGSHINFTFSGTPSTVFTFDDTVDALCTVLDGTTYFMGTYSNYVTVGTFSADKADSSYAARLYTAEGGNEGGGEETPDPETPSTGNYVTAASQLSTTATYKLGLFSTAKNATYYFTGAMSGYYGATETDWATAIDVQLEAANGGYYLTFTKDSKQYVNIVASGSHINFTFSGTPSTVFTFDDTVDALCTVVNGTTYFMGTYSNFVTVGTFSADKADSSYAARLYTAEGGNEGGGEETPDPETPSLPAADSTLTIAQALAAARTLATNTKTDDRYYVTGTITDITSTQYGNMYIKDANGDKIYVYGLYSADGTDKYEALATKPVVGDTIKVYARLGNYQEPQLSSAWLQEILSGESGGNEGGNEGGNVGTSAVMATGTWKLKTVFGGKDVYLGAFNSNKFEAADANTAVSYYLVVDGDSVTIYDDETKTIIYSYGGSKTSLTATGTVGSWKFVETEGGYYLYDATVTNRYLGYNSGSPSFRAYTGKLEADDYGMVIALVGEGGGETGGESGGEDSGDETQPPVDGELTSGMYLLQFTYNGTTYYADAFDGGKFTTSDKGVPYYIEITSDNTLNILDAATKTTYYKYSGSSTGLSAVTTAAGWSFEVLENGYYIYSGTRYLGFSGVNSTIRGYAASNLTSTDYTMVVSLVPYTGTVDSVEIPTTPADIMAAAKALAEGESLPSSYTLTGKVTEVETDSYGNVSVTISVDGTEDTIYCYKITGEGVDALAVGDHIKVTGPIKNYKGTIEFNVCTFVSMDSVAKSAAPATASVAEALEPVEELPTEEPALIPED